MENDISFLNMFVNLSFCCNKAFDSKTRMLRKMNSIIFGKFSEFSLNPSLRQSKQITNVK